MRRTLGSMAILVAFAAVPAMGMDVDDILELCRAGFEPDRIARIVEAAGLDQPLEAADWSRIKTEGCGDQVVDALLDVLAPVEAEAEYEDESYESDRDVDINLYGSWGTNGWYGSVFWGGYSPWWGAGYGWYDPWWDWRWHWASWDWYDPWWCYPHHWRYYCHTWYSPYYYCHDHYTGGYYYGGVYERQKASRQGGSAKAYRYAAAKTSPAVVQATYASAKAKPYRGGTVVSGLNETGGAAIRKSTRTNVSTADGSVYTKTRSKTAARGSSGLSTGNVKSRSSSTSLREGNTYSKRKTGIRGGGATSTGNSSPTVTRSKTKSRTTPGSSGSTGSGTTVKRKSSGGTDTSKSPSTVSPGGTKPSGSSFRTPSSTSAPRGTAAPRGGTSHGSGGARVKGGR